MAFLIELAHVVDERRDIGMRSCADRLLVG